MKRIVVHFFCMVVVMLFALACTKEVSEEVIGLRGTATGTLTDTSGNCKNAIIRGTYKVDTTLTDSNYVVVNVNFTVTGKYRIYSDTVNGMWFLDSGFALATGATTVRLKGKGRPLLPGSSDFIFTLGNSFCKFTITTTGVNNGSSTNDYLPTTPNGYITYQLTPALTVNNNDVDTFRATISPTTLLFPNPGGRTFYKYQHVPISGESYYAKESGTYYTIGTPEFEFFSIYDTIVNNATLVYPYLRDNVSPSSPAASWNTDSLRVGYISTGTTIIYGWARLKITILSTGLTVNYFGVPFSNVIKVKREMQFKPDSGGSTAVFSTLLSGELYYAKGIGLIDQVIDLGAGDSQSVTIKKYNGL